MRTPASKMRTHRSQLRREVALLHRLANTPARPLAKFSQSRPAKPPRFEPRGSQDRDHLGGRVMLRSVGDMGPPPTDKFLAALLLRSGCAGRAGKQMTVPMSVQESIRTLDSQGVPGREIARTLGVSRESVAKYARQPDYSPGPPQPRSRPEASVLTGHEHIIEQ